MFEIVRTKNFEKSYKRIKRSGKLKKRDVESIEEMLEILASNQRLPTSYRDHQLKGELQDYRECHIKGDLLLVYQIRKKELVLILLEIGTHSYLGL